MVAVLLVLVGCGKFEYSPYAFSVPEMPEKMNLVNMERLKAREALDDDTLTIVFTGDPQRFYEEQEAIVEKANSIPGVDMFIMAGDIADFGLLQEFMWVHERMERLRMPWFAVVGNHDLQANGAEVFKRLFGPLDFSFSYKGYKFLFHDTNGREYGNDGAVPRIPWLEAQMRDAAPDHFIAVAHVPPFDGDFDPVLERPYVQQLASDERMLLALYGHRGSHSDGFPYNDHVRYMVCNAMYWPVFTVLRIHQGDVVKVEYAYTTR